MKFKIRFTEKLSAIRSKVQEIIVNLNSLLKTVYVKLEENHELERNEIVFSSQVNESFIF